MVIVDPIDIERKLLAPKRARADDDETDSEGSSSETTSEPASTPHSLETPGHSRSGSFASLSDDGAPPEPATTAFSPPPRVVAAAAESPLDLLVESALWVRQRETTTP